MKSLTLPNKGLSTLEFFILLNTQAMLPLQRPPPAPQGFSGYIRLTIKGFHGTWPFARICKVKSLYIENFSFFSAAIDPHFYSDFESQGL